MNLALTTLPSSIDILHLGLILLVLILLVLNLRKGNRSSEAPINTPIEIGKSKEEVSSAPTEQAKNEKPPTKVIREADPESAYQLLSILQSEARFIDFISEDLTGFSDQQIGGAARVVQEGAKKAINKYFSLEPVRSEAEESQITLPAGFNPAEVRLTGKVLGEPPFKGVLVHKGWKVNNSQLPKMTEGHDAKILAAAEIEL